MIFNSNIDIGYKMHFIQIFTLRHLFYYFILYKYLGHSIQSLHVNKSFVKIFHCTDSSSKNIMRH